MFHPLVIAFLFIVSPVMCRETVTATATSFNTVTDTVTRYDQTVCIKYISATEICKNRKNYMVDDFGAVEIQLIEPKPVVQVQATELPVIEERPVQRKRWKNFLNRSPALQSSKNEPSSKTGKGSLRNRYLSFRRPIVTVNPRAPGAGVLGYMFRHPYTWTVAKVVDSTVYSTVVKTTTKTLIFSGCVFSKYPDQICPN